MLSVDCPLSPTLIMSAVYHPHHIYVARATTGAPILGEAAYARNRGQTSSAWLLMLVWHMPECCSSAIAHAGQGVQLFRSGLHVSRLLVHLQHLGRAIARIVCVCHMLCAGLDKGCAAVACCMGNNHDADREKAIRYAAASAVYGDIVPFISRAECFSWSLSRLKSTI